MGNMRTLVIGDVHGHLGALQSLLGHVAPGAEDQLVFLGDYVDKGPDVKGTINYLMELSQKFQVIFLRGNHDQMMLDAWYDESKLAVWAGLAGEHPLSGYGDGPLSARWKAVPREHWAFLERTCRDFWETPAYIFVHGGIRPEMAPADESPDRLQWLTLSTAEPHLSGRTVLCGHSELASGRIADLGHTIGIDTAIADGGWLTCLALDTFEFWQVKAGGEFRQGVLAGRGNHQS
jgi:serine/threonine protein phosphatase 1